MTGRNEKRKDWRSNRGRSIYGSGTRPERTWSVMISRSVTSYARSQTWSGQVTDAVQAILHKLYGRRGLFL